MDKAPSRVLDFNQRIFILKGLFPFLVTFAKSTVAVAVAVATRQVGSCVKLAVACSKMPPGMPILMQQA